MRISGLMSWSAAVVWIVAAFAAAPASADPGFAKSWLAGEATEYPTSLQWGPDDRLYVAQASGAIVAYTIARNGSNDYAVTATETIGNVIQIPNHDDDGQLNTDYVGRLVTGLLVTGTAADPTIYVASSDPRLGGGPGATDLDLDTNSGVVSRLTRAGATWSRQDLVRGLPRSEENHTANGLALSSDGGTLFVAQGGNTNHGAPSANFVSLPEFAYSAAILSIDLGAIGSGTYDLPTLDDETRPGEIDAGDPFGGNNGRNQARLTAGSPVQVYAPGFRNPYDLVRTSDDRLFTIDNGGNAGWGGAPVGEGPGGACTNAAAEGGESEPDGLHLVTAGYYGGHPNPARGNLANTFNAGNPQAAVPAADPVQCDQRPAGSSESTALATFPGSTNGIDEYTSPGALNGDLLAVGLTENAVYRIERTAAGDGVAGVSTLASNLGAAPLDLDAAPATAPYPGTVWIADLDGVAGQHILVLEPSAGPCGGLPGDDDDADGYTNGDEADNATNPCSQADQPPDADSDRVSDRNDPDDDNDGRPDVSDPFAVDSQNGLATAMPLSYTWDNDAPSPGKLLGLGFTGLMTNGATDYGTIYDRAALTAGGAAGVLTIDAVGSGDASGSQNTQTQAFQLGVDPSSAAGRPFEVTTRLLDPFAARTLGGEESAGLFVGTGGQDDFFRISAGRRDGRTGVHADLEIAGVPSARAEAALALPLGGAPPRAIELFLVVDPVSRSIQPGYRITAGGQAGQKLALGPPVAIPSVWLSGAGQGLAVGVIGTSRGGAPFPATWDSIAVRPVAEPLVSVPPLAPGPEAPRPPSSPGRTPGTSPRPSSARFSGSSRTLVVRRGAVTVPVRCTAPAGQRCRGRAVLDTRARVRLTAGSAPRIVRLGSRAFSVSASTRAAVTVRLTRAGTRLITARGSVATTVTLTTAARGVSSAQRIRVTVRSARRH